jgi:hypothetical protein
MLNNNIRGPFLLHLLGSLAVTGALAAAVHADVIAPAAQPSANAQAPAPQKATAQVAVAQTSAPQTARKFAEGPAAARVEVDALLRQARIHRDNREWEQGKVLMLEAANRLKQIGFEQDQVSILREMTMESDAGYVEAGSRAMADYYFRRYLASRPRDAQWLLEALAWANYAGADDLVKKYSPSARPDKEHSNIIERGRVRGEELKADDQLYMASELIRLSKNNELTDKLANWPYSINRIHSLQGASLLHMAVWYKKTDIATMLVEKYNADVNVTDNEKDTPLDYAYHQKVDELVKFLKSKGAKANKQYQQKNTAAPIKK